MWSSMRAVLALKLCFAILLIAGVYRSFDATDSLADSEVSSGKGAGEGITIGEVAQATSGGEDSFEIPDVPKGTVSLSDGVRIREQLELVKKDVEDKIARLAKAKKAYDQAKLDIDAKLQRIQEERRLLEETLQREKKAKEERLSEALEFVAKMEPRKAAPVLEGMDRDLVIHLLRKLPKRQVTKILEAVSPKKASEFMEYYTRIRSAREYEFMKEVLGCDPENPEGAPPTAPGQRVENKGTNGLPNAADKPVENGQPAADPAKPAKPPEPSADSDAKEPAAAERTASRAPGILQ